MIVLLATLAASALMAQTPASKPEKTGDLQALLEEREKAGWEAYKNKDAKAFTQLATSDYTAVIADGKPPRDLQGTLEAMNAVTIHHYACSDFKLTILGPNAAVLSYNASVKVTLGGDQAQDVKLAVTDVWVRRGGQWKAVRYHESEFK